MATGRTATKAAKVMAAETVVVATVMAEIANQMLPMAALTKTTNAECSEIATAAAGTSSIPGTCSDS